VVAVTVQETATVTQVPATTEPSPSAVLEEPVPTTPADPLPTTTAASTFFTMPNLVGENLQLGQDKLQALGSYLMDQQDAAGLSRLQVNDSNWKVCKQSPAPGTKAPTETVVVLSAVKLAEQCP
jgi:hypothetical protein